MMTLPTFLSQAVVNTCQEINRTFGQRLGEMVTSTSLREHQEKSQQHIPVEEIVAKEKLAYVEHLSEARKKTEKSLLNSALSQEHKTSQVGKELWNILTVSSGVPRTVSDPFRTQCLLGSPENDFSDSSKAIAASLIQDMVEQVTLFLIFLPITSARKNAGMMTQSLYLQ